MSNEMTEAEFWAALAPVAPPKVIFRLYYDADGLPLFYSMQDEPGNYIEIDQELFSNPPTYVRVVDGKLKVLNTGPVPKLVPSNAGTTCDPHDVCVVVAASKPHIKWSTKTNDTN